MTVRVSTDGSGTASGPGGWACVLRCGDLYKEFSGAVPEATNNSMEIMAAVMGLRAIKVPCDVEVVTDSEYLRNSARTHIAKWISNGWRTSTGDPVKNKEIWLLLKAEIERHNSVTWFWVKGHSGDVDNERCDVLAGEARATLLPPKPEVKKHGPASVAEKLAALSPAALRAVLAEMEPAALDRLRQALGSATA